MKKFALVLLSCVFLISCGGGGSDNATAAVGGPEDELVGEWLLVYDGTLCEETFVFNSNGSFSIESLDELVSGSYSVSALSGNVDRNRITLTILTDNGLSDCEGDSTDDSNTEGDLYYEITSNTLIFYEFENSSVALAELDRQ